MIIEQALRVAAGVSLTLSAWGAIMLALPFVGPGGRQVAVVGEPADMVRIIRAADGRIVEVRDGAVIARSDARGFVAALYRAGAPLVIEGRAATGCMAISGA